MINEQNKPRQIVRLMGTDIPGTINLQKGLTKVRGIGANLSHTICTRMNIDGNMIVGSMKDTELKEIEIKLKAMDGVESWMLNRQNDYDTGDNKHLLTTDLKLTRQFDQKRMQKIKSYRGLRLAAGLPVRGQRTKAHFRKGGKAVGVKRKGKK
jgi:small subunit ribosomal protein S13